MSKQLGTITMRMEDATARKVRALAIVTNCQITETATSLIEYALEKAEAQLDKKERAAWLAMLEVIK